MLDNLKSLLISKRFWAAVGGVVWVLTDGLGLPLTADQVNESIWLVLAWIAADTFRPSIDKV